ncbi:nickel insertion protein, partial [Paracoccus thiocyanatus]|uniref:nickel insertion protein n=1 Tax=Paracoccus thiocyanatus TaxID=34006 RepID=UPI0011C04207
MHIHLDALGGVAGDMFVAALLDAWPELADQVQANLRLAGLKADVDAQALPHDDGVLTGHRFVVTKDGKTDAQADDHHHHHHDHGDHHHHRDDHGHDHHGHHAGHGHHHHHRDDHGHHHHHTHWRDLRASLAASALPEPVKHTAIGIFHELAKAEAQVHGKELDAVAFHEVGNWDSIADIAAAATLIVGTGASSWSVGALPLGRGWVETDHGRLPRARPGDDAAFCRALPCTTTAIRAS